MTSESKPGKFTDPWFTQWPETASYTGSDGHDCRIPLRLESSNLVVYGRASMAEALKEFEHEDFQPVTVGGDVPVQIWFNDFTDTDCGPRGPHQCLHGNLVLVPGYGKARSAGPAV